MSRSSGTTSYVLFECLTTSKWLGPPQPPVVVPGFRDIFGLVSYWVREVCPRYSDNPVQRRQTQAIYPTRRALWRRTIPIDTPAHPNHTAFCDLPTQGVRNRFRSASPHHKSVALYALDQFNHRHRPTGPSKLSSHQESQHPATNVVFVWLGKIIPIHNPIMTRPYDTDRRPV